MQRQFQNLAGKRNGYLLTADVVAAGISKPCLAENVRRKNLEKVAHGVYMFPDAWPDEYFLIYLRNRKIIFSHESALFLHQMTDREPSFVSVTVSAGYNATHLRKKGIRVYQVKPEFYGLGLAMAETNFHHEVAAYDRERTICDTIRYHDSIDSQTFRTALNEYMKSSKKDLNRLIKYARAFEIEKIVKMYVEVMT